MIVEVVSDRGAVISEQCRDGVQGAIARRQRLIDLVLHHGAGGIVAVVAAEAHEQAGNVRRVPADNAGRQHCSWLSHVRFGR